MPWIANAMAGYRLTYPQARSWLVNAGIDPSPYDNSEYDMLDCLVDLIQEKRWYPDKILVNPIDDPITCEPVLKKELLESSGFKDDHYDYQQHPAPFRV